MLISESSAMEGITNIVFMFDSTRSQCDNRHSSTTNALTIYVVKKQVDWKDCCDEYWCQKARKHMGR